MINDIFVYGFVLGMITGSTVTEFLYYWDRKHPVERLK